jgi:hypothetical protein
MPNDCVITGIVRNVERTTMVYDFEIVLPNENTRPEGAAIPYVNPIIKKYTPANFEPETFELDWNLPKCK